MRGETLGFGTRRIKSVGTGALGTTPVIIVVTLVSRTPWNTVALRCIPRNNPTRCCLLPLAVFAGSPER
jgi:hypothetical protein